MSIGRPLARSTRSLALCTMPAPRAVTGHFLPFATVSNLAAQVADFAGFIAADAITD
jgi:hypothetical protein